MKRFICIGTITLITVLVFNGCKEDDPYWDPNKYIEVVMDHNNNAYDFNLGFVNAASTASNFDGIYNEPWCTDLPALCGNFETTNVTSFASLSAAPSGSYVNDCREVPLNTVLVFLLNNGSYALVKVVSDMYDEEPGEWCHHTVTLQINYPAFTGSSNNNNNNNNQPVTGTFTDTRDNKVYKTVTIGAQVWMAENLAYLPFVVPSGSDYESYYAPRIYVYGYEGTNVSEASSTQNYKTYGALYNWPAALEVCPAGWELPTYDDWEELSEYLGGNTVSGGKLKETGFDHWLNPNTNATDEVGFSALPGGYRHHDDGRGFLTLNETGYWWSATAEDEERAWRRDISYNMYDLALHDYHKEHGYSVRCIKSDERYGYITDVRDSRTYKTIQIGEQNWMAENLAWIPDGIVYPPQTAYRSYTEPRYYVYGYFGGDVVDDYTQYNYNTYGALYNWPAALSACPEGWRLPSYDDWQQLSDYLGGNLVSGGKLKETGYGHWYSPNTNATDEVLFSALPGGFRYHASAFGSTEGGYNTINETGYWWSSTASGSDRAWRRDISYNMYDLALHDYHKEHGYSVRCIEGESSGGNNTGNGEVSFGSFTDSRDGYTYKTVTIGDQVWMAENLRATKYTNQDDIGTTQPGTLDIGDEVAPKYQWSYQQTYEYAQTYGRLYTWYTATDPRGLCPTGWHLPSDEEWRTLEQYLSQNGYNCDGVPATSLEDSHNLIAKAMSDTYGWEASSNIYTVGNTSDAQTESYRNKSGFSAIPGGERGMHGEFNSIGSVAIWWSSMTDNSYLNAAVCRSISTDGSNLIRYPKNKNFGQSVRCIQDDANGSGGVTETFTDGKDGKVYKTLTIGGNVWMAENYAYLPFVTDAHLNNNNMSTEEPMIYVSNYYDTDVQEAKNTEEYLVKGALYNWVAANQYVPAGWHLPTLQEWAALDAELGSGSNSGSKMKLQEYWEGFTNGATNESGFSTVPGGMYEGGFANSSNKAYFWTSTVEGSIDKADGIYLGYDNMLYVESFPKENGMSVRYVKD